MIVSLLAAAVTAMAQQPDAASSSVEQSRLTPEQQGLQHRLQQTAHDAGAKMAGITPESWTAIPTTPERYAHAAKILDYENEVLHAYAKAAADLYAALSPEQRVIADQETRFDGSAYGAPPEAPLPGDLTFASPNTFGRVEAKWLVKPSGDTVSRFYPLQAMAARVSGAVRVRCTVDVDGYPKDCRVIAESPADMGFGNAGLQLTAFMRFTPALTAGMPTRATVVVPLTFKAPASVQSTAQPPVSFPAP